jgi:nicotinamidase-related amidase
MQRAHGMEVPDTVAEMCRPDRSAVLVYDAQAGILAHIRDRDAVVERMSRVLAAARANNVPVIYARHVSVPCGLEGGVPLWAIWPSKPSSLRVWRVGRLS